MIRALSHVAIRVTDIDKALNFYLSVLGLSEQFRLEKDGKPWLVYIKVAQNQFIELFPGAAAPHQKTESAGTVHLCLEVDDIQRAYRELASRGVVSSSAEPVLGADGAWQFWIQDPDGNPIEFHQFTSGSRQITG
ncbi:MAG: VOC family protein [Armatimonadetes bacterium]|nr:VOC family protein [Armatimonadota bacterium]